MKIKKEEQKMKFYDFRIKVIKRYAPTINLLEVKKDINNLLAK